VLISLLKPGRLPAGDYWVYFGTFTGALSKGIYVSRLTGDTGKLTEPTLAAPAASPNFLAVSPNHQFLYAACRGAASGDGVAAFKINPGSGSLERLDQKPSGGSDPCHVSVSPDGRCLLLANYGDGSVQSYRIQSDGTLSEGSFQRHQGSSINLKRQQGPHAHCFVPDPTGQYALACDLGLDKVMIYRLESRSAKLTPHRPAFASVPPGSGPRHLVFSPDASRVYVVNEMACTVSAFQWSGEAGTLQPLETVSLLPSGESPKDSVTAAEIAVHPNGRFIYTTLRGHDSVSVLTTGQTGEGVKLLDNVPSGGAVPRGMGLDPSGGWLIVANQKSSTVQVFKIDPGTGKLVPANKPVAVASPVDVKFVPAP